MIDGVACPQAGEVTLAGVAAMDAALRPACFGDQPLALVGFLPPFVGGSGCGDSTVPGDGWLSDCSANGISFLVRLPVSMTEDVPGIYAVLAPTLEFDVGSAEPGSQLRLRGHFDDEAAQRCQTRTGPGTVTPDVRAVERCREVFVIDEVLGG